MFSLATVRTHAKKSRNMHFWHVAILTRGGAIVSIGYNRGYEHAEEMALRKLWPDHRSGLTLWSYRITKAGKLAMAEPCEFCQELLRSNGIKRVRYSDRTGKMQKMKL